MTVRRMPRHCSVQISHARLAQRRFSSVRVGGSWMMPRFPVKHPPRLGGRDAVLERHDSPESGVGRDFAQRHGRFKDRTRWREADSRHQTRRSGNAFKRRAARNGA